MENSYRDHTQIHGNRNQPSPITGFARGLPLNHKDRWMTHPFFLPPQKCDGFKTYNQKGTENANSKPCNRKIHVQKGGCSMAGKGTEKRVVVQFADLAAWAKDAEKVKGWGIFKMVMVIEMQMCVCVLVFVQ